MFSSETSTNQRAFAEFMAGLWDAAPGSFLHGYPTTRSRHWTGWRQRVPGHGGQWWCASLSEAAARYSWADAKPGLSFEILSARLQANLNSDDIVAVRQTSLDIFAWGGVGRRADDKSRRWIEEQARNGTLAASLRDAVCALRPGSADDLKRFDGVTFPMNAAMTKVYAAIDPDRLMIYDGRVGAALGFLARIWLESTARRGVPSDLAFGWGAKQNDQHARNPSSGNYSFSSLYLPSSAAMHQDCRWAAGCRKASQIAGAVADIRGLAGVREIETALFMIGYNVRTGLDPHARRPPVSAAF